MTRKRSLLGVLLALAVAVALLVLFVSRPTRAERLLSQVRVGGTLKEARAVLGDPDTRSKHGSLYFWFVGGDEIVVRIDLNQTVIAKELRKQPIDRPTQHPLRLIVNRARELIGLD